MGYSKKENKRIYNIWNGMVGRCHRKTSENYKLYGEKGIFVCDEWLKFQNFCKWSLYNGYRNTLTIDRIDNNKGYSPENCRWVTEDEQHRNRSDNHTLTFDDRTQCVSDWANEVGIKRNTIYERLNRGWSVRDALTKPLKDKTYVFNGEEKTLKEWSEELNINFHTLESRIYNSKWCINKALTTPIRKYVKKD